MNKSLFSSRKSSAAKPKIVIPPLTGRNISHESSFKLKKLSLTGTKVFLNQASPRKGLASAKVTRKIKSAVITPSAKHSEDKKINNLSANQRAYSCSTSLIKGNVNAEKPLKATQIILKPKDVSNMAKPLLNKEGTFKKVSYPELKEEVIKTGKFMLGQRRTLDAEIKKASNFEEYKKFSKKIPQNIQDKQKDSFSLSILSSSLKAYQQEGYVSSQQTAKQIKMIPLINSVLSIPEKEVIKDPESERAHSYLHELYKPTPLFSCSAFLQRKQMREALISKIGNALSSKSKILFDLFEEARLDIIKHSEWFTSGKAQTSVYSLFGKIEDEWLKQFEEEEIQRLIDEQKKREKELAVQINSQEIK